jgi:2-phospho-L-lactate/phosphoenolpyruvate guanylyltransferase
MNTWLVLPMKSLLDGKSRLAPALDLEQRRALLERMFRHTLDQAAQYPGLDRTLVVSGCSQTRARAAALGAQILEEDPGAGLNGGLRQAQLVLRQQGASHMIVVHCDLPLLDTCDLRHLAQAASAGSISIAPDRKREGTNGLCIQAAMDFGFSFGPDSFSLHLEQAVKSGIKMALVESIGLGFDVDLPEDLAQFAKLDYSHHAPLVS